MVKVCENFINFAPNLRDSLAYLHNLHFYLTFYLIIIQSMKKFLLSAVACLAVAGVASADDLYIRGGNFGWNAEHCTDANKFTDLGDGNYTITLDKLDTGFKIADNTWGANNWGSASNIELDKEYTLTNSGASGNITIKGGASFSNVTINFNTTTGVMKCTGVKQETDWSTITMFLVGDEFGWADSTTQCTYADGIFTVTVAAITETTMFKISNPPAWSYQFGDNCALEGNAAEYVASADNDYNLTSSKSLTNVTITLNPSAEPPVMTINEVGAGVEAVEVEATEAAAVYYNLQGVRVANPAEGMYIRVQAGKASKVVL